MATFIHVPHMGIIPMGTDVLVLTDNAVRHVLLNGCKADHKKIAAVQDSNTVNTAIVVSTAIHFELTRYVVRYIEPSQVWIPRMLGLAEFVG